MTDHLQTIKARHTTEGPWTTKPHPFRRDATVTVNADEQYVAHYVNPDDAEFIAACRTDVPWLVAEVERLREVGR